MSWLPADELDRLRVCLERLLRHVDSAQVALTGGIATQWHMTAAGLRGERRTIADVDLVARSVDAVSPTIIDDFLVVHYHLPHSGYPKFMVQLVHPPSRLRVDIFPDLVGSLDTASRVDIAGLSVQMLSAESVLDHKLLYLSKASTTMRREEKYQRDALALASICGRQVRRLPPSFFEQPTYWPHDLACPRCDATRSPRFPLATNRQVIEILGYA